MLRKRYPKRARAAIADARKCRFEFLEDRRLLAVYEVETAAGDLSEGSLRWAIAQAESISGADQVTFDATFFSTPRTIELEGEITIFTEVVVTGPGSGLLTIVGSAGTLAAGDGVRIFSGGSAAPVAISGMTLRGGGDAVSGDGGAILASYDSLSLTDISFVDHEVLGSGGAISLQGNAAILNCVFDGNVAASGGGAIYAAIFEDQSMTITFSEFYRNRAVAGGAVLVANGGSSTSPGEVVITTSVFNENKAIGEPGAEYDGGAVYISYAGPFASGANVEVSSSSFRNNEAKHSGGALVLRVSGDDLPAKVANSTFVGNEARGTNPDAPDPFLSGGIWDVAGGGGLWIENTVEGAIPVDVVNVTVSGNRANSGGGMMLEGAVAVRHSTIVDNEAGLFLEELPVPNPFDLEGESTAGGGVLIRNVVYPGVSGVSVTFDHTIVARNRHTTGQRMNSPNIGATYQAPRELFPDEIAAYQSTNGGHIVWLSNVCLAGPVPDDANFLDPEVEWAALRDFFYTSLDFDYSIIDNRGGPLAPCTGAWYEGKLMQFLSTNVVIEANPLIEPLADNGGTQLPDGTHLFTHELVCEPDNPAIDAGSFTTAPSDVPYDERGPGHPRVFDGPDPDSLPRIDIGAFELGPTDVPSLAADFDDDGDVDSDDLTIWRQNFGLRTATNEDGDADGDGDVDADDLEVWRLQFGTNTPSNGRDADFNNDGFITGADFIIWQQHLGLMTASNSDGDADGDGDVDGNDFLIWQRELGMVLDPACADWIDQMFAFDNVLDLTYDPSGNKIVVSTLVDENDGDYSLGDLSLREALVIANAIAGENEIVFADHLSGTIELNGTQLQVTSDVTIHGPGIDRLAIDAHRDSNVFYVAPDVDATIAGLTITGGGNVQEGGGIFNAGRLTLDGVAVIDNEVAYTVYSNTQGGGVVTRNHTGRTDASLWLINSTVAGNRARAGGGLEINLGSAGVLVIDGSTISDNVADNGQGLGAGGGVRFVGASGASATIKSSTISGNSAVNSGGVRVWSNSASLLMVNATVAYNTGDGGGGVHVVSSGSTVTLHNTLVAKNQTNAAVNSDIGGGLNAASSHNILAAGAGSVTPTGANNQIGTPSTPVDAKLGPLADNGGPTRTHKLAYDSPALDAANFSIALANGLGTDQRGYSRFVYNPSSGGSFVDMGAYEYGLIVTVPNDPTTNGYARNDLSLREAIAQAAIINPTGSLGKSVIEFVPETYDGTLGNGVFTLTSFLQIASPVEIVGPGADLLTLNAASGQRAFLITDYNASTLHDVSISGLAVDGDNVGSSADGGAIWSAENITLNALTITGATARSGGGFYQYYAGGGSVTIVDSTFTGNVAHWGGGAAIDTVGAVAISGSTFHDNDAVKWFSGGNWVAGSGSAGGLLIKNVSSSNQARVVNTTISGNRAEHDSGGLSVNNAYVTLVNDTIAFNSAAGGSGIVGGVRYWGGSLTLHNTILAGNTINGGMPSDVAASVAFNAASSHNLIGVGGNSGLTHGVNGNLVGSSAAPLNPRLEALADNGGPTWTHRLLPYSPAFDAGDNEKALGLIFDQRGELRIQDGYLDGLASVDIGAYEASADEYFSTV